MAADSIMTALEQCKFLEITTETMRIHTVGNFSASNFQGSKAFNKLKKVARARTLLADMPQLSSSFQTYGLETYHSLLLHFPPNFCQNSSDGVKAR